MSYLAYLDKPTGLHDLFTEAELKEMTFRLEWTVNAITLLAATVRNLELLLDARFGTTA